MTLEVCADFEAGRLCRTHAARCGPEPCRFSLLPSAYANVRTRMCVVNPRAQMRYKEYYRARNLESNCRGCAYFGANPPPGVPPRERCPGCSRNPARLETAADNFRGRA